VRRNLINHSVKRQKRVRTGVRVCHAKRSCPLTTVTSSHVCGNIASLATRHKTPDMAISEAVQDSFAREARAHLPVSLEGVALESRPLRSAWGSQLRPNPRSGRSGAPFADDAVRHWLLLLRIRSCPSSLSSR
jgi:hypothetical protein